MSDDMLRDESQDLVQDHHQPRLTAEDLRSDPANAADLFVDHDEEPRSRSLPFTDVMAYILRQWRRRPALFIGLSGFTAVATVLDVFTPVAAGLMIDALTAPDSNSDAHWAGYVIFMAVAIGFHAFRQLAVRCEIPFSSANSV